MRRRLVLSYLALTVMVLAALEIPLALSYAQRQREQLQNSLLRDAFTISAFAEDTLEGNADVDLQALADHYDQRTGARVVIVDGTGGLRADSEPTIAGQRSFADRPEIAAALDRRIATGQRMSDTLDTQLIYVAVPAGSGDSVHGAVRLTYSTRQLDDRVHRYWMLLGGIAAVSLAAATGVGLLLSRWVTRPIEELRAAATTFGSGELDARAPVPKGPPELRELAGAFNATAARLEDLVTAQDQFVADASHQLRTPLTALRLRLEMLEDDVGGPGTEGAGDLAGARREVARLSRLVDGLLALARAEPRPADNEAEQPLALQTLVTDRQTAWEPVADERRVQLVSDCPPLLVHAEPDRLSQVLDNLLANALEASPSGTTITLSATAVTRPLVDQRRAVELHVTDHGPGLTTEQRARAFDRFWRASSAPSELGGSGLGLSIVEKLVRAEGGTVELRETPGGGLDVVVRLAAAAPAG